MTKQTPGPHFVWVRGVGGKLWPQKWQSLDYGMNNWRREFVVKAYPITAGEYEFAPLDQLAFVHPVPKETAEAA